MLKLYVTEMPKSETECPFYNSNNKKCGIDSSKCCLQKNSVECEHLITLRFDFMEEEE